MPVTPHARRERSDDGLDQPGPDQTTRVVVAYGTKNGSTAGIAETTRTDPGVDARDRGANSETARPRQDDNLDRTRVPVDE
jgi:hypothetical protein